MIELVDCECRIMLRNRQWSVTDVSKDNDKGSRPLRRFSNIFLKSRRHSETKIVTSFRYSVRDSTNIDSHREPSTHRQPVITYVPRTTGFHSSPGSTCHKFRAGVSKLWLIREAEVAISSLVNDLGTSDRTLGRVGQGEAWQNQEALCVGQLASTSGRFVAR